MNPAFWRGRRVLLTGHTGFKGAWLALWLEHLGAEVTGYSLEPSTNPALFRILEPWPQLDSIIDDVRNGAALAKAVASSRPEIVVHMAAQALVGVSLRDPIETFSTNAMGTVHLLDKLREASSLKAVLVVTSDKVYRHTDSGRHFAETDHLGGADPYSASKAVQELVTASFASSYFEDGSIPLATARAGNVIGGGDWAPDRLVPDFIRSLQSEIPFQLRHPEATRPWQHVLEPLSGYLLFAEYLHSGGDTRALNFGPDEPSSSVADVVTRMATATRADASWTRQEGGLWSERDELQLDSSAAAKILGWRPRLRIDQAIDWTARWYLANQADEDMRAFSLQQIADYSGQPL